MKPKTGVTAATLIVAALASITIARAQDNPPAMPPNDAPMTMEPGAEAGAPPMQMTPDDETMGQTGQMGMMGMMMMMQQMSEMMELCMQMMRSMVEAPPVDTGGKP